MARSPIKLSRDREPVLDILSAGRRGPDGRPIQFTQSQIAQIARTVRRTPEVMVKVTGGGTSSGAPGRGRISRRRPLLRGASTARANASRTAGNPVHRPHEIQGGAEGGEGGAGYLSMSRPSARYRPRRT